MNSEVQLGVFIRYFTKISRGLRPLNPPWGFGAPRRTARIGASRLLIYSEHRHLVSAGLAAALLTCGCDKIAHSDTIIFGLGLRCE